MLRGHSCMLPGCSCMLRNIPAHAYAPRTLLHAPGTILHAPGTLFLHAPGTHLHAQGTLLHSPGTMLTWTLLGSRCFRPQVLQVQNSPFSIAATWKTRFVTLNQSWALQGSPGFSSALGALGRRCSRDTFLHCCSLEDPFLSPPEDPFCDPGAFFGLSWPQNSHSRCDSVIKFPCSSISLALKICIPVTIPY